MNPTCKYCCSFNGGHQDHCPEVNGKMVEWLTGYNAAKEGNLENEPTIERSETDIPGIFRLRPNGDLTYGLGWVIYDLERTGIIV